jgi:hypothetical protein
MEVALEIFGVAFAACCVWLGVRVYNRRERWAKRTLFVLTIAVPLLYFLSVGPAQWIISRKMLSQDAIAHVTMFYGPTDRFYRAAPQPIKDVIDWYLDLWEP